MLFVTSDNKEDWWRKDDNKDKDKQKSLGPRPELADELMQVSGRRLFMLPPERLLHWARTVLDVEVSDESVQDVKQVSATADVVWNTRAQSDEVSIDSSGFAQARNKALLRALLFNAVARKDLGDQELSEAVNRYDAKTSLLALLSDPVTRNIAANLVLRDMWSELAEKTAAGNRAQHMDEIESTDSVADQDVNGD